MCVSMTLSEENCLGMARIFRAAPRLKHGGPFHSINEQNIYKKPFID